MFVQMREKNFSAVYIYCAGLVAVTISVTAFNIDLMVELLKITGSIVNTALTSIILSGVGILGNVFINPSIARYSSTRCAQIVLCIVFVSLIIFSMGAISHWDEVALSYTAAGGIGLSNALLAPIEASLLKSVTSKENLVRANSIVQSCQQVVFVSGYGVGALIVSHVSQNIMVSLIVFPIITCFVFWSSLPNDRRSDVGTDENYIKKLRQGWTSFLGNRVVVMITLLDIAETTANMVWMSALLLAYTERALHESPEWWGFQGSAFSLGSILGGAIAVRWAKAISRSIGTTIAISNIGVAAIAVGYAITNSAIVAVCLSFVTGPTFIPRDVAQRAILQVSVDQDLITPVFSARNVVLQIFGIPALALMAFIGEISIRGVYLAAALVYLVVAIISWRYRPFRDAGVFSEQV